MDTYYNYRLLLLLLQSVFGVLPFSYSLQKRKYFLGRLVLSTAVSMICLELFKRWIFPDATVLTGGHPRAIVSILCYIFLIGICFFSYRESFYTALFIASSGYIAQDMAGYLKSFVRVAPVIDKLSQDPYGVLAIDIFIFGLVYSVLYFAFRSFTQNTEENYDNKEKGAFSFVVLVYCIGMARLTMDNAGRNNKAMIAECLYQFLCDIFILLLQFGVMERKRLENGVVAMKELVHQQYEQLQNSKESMDLVNEKYHDLKRLLDNFDGQFSQGQIDKLRNKISEYDNFVDTGNDILDVVLAERAGMCKQKGIVFTTLVNGTKIGFMEEIEIYSLFGNILSNAFEAACELPEGKRFISLNIKEEDGIVSIHSENPYVGKIIIKDNLPRTQKDSNFNGFGMKSIERVVDKYNGTMAVKTDDGLFVLDIILFRPE